MKAGSGRSLAGLAMAGLLSVGAAVATPGQIQFKLQGTGTAGPPALGFSVALSADGTTAAAGGPRDDAPVDIGNGAAWVFTRNGYLWSQQGGKLVANDATGTAQQGIAVALSGDGNTLLVGGPFDNGEVGAAWIFARSGGTWSQVGTKLTGSDAAPIPGSWQGIGVALSADGSTAAVGGMRDNITRGAVWIYVNGPGGWTQQGPKLVASGAAANGLQGRSVALSADGNTLLVGAPFDTITGAAYVYTRSNGTWTQQGGALVGDVPASVTNVDSGWSVALSADGNTALVGAPFDANQAGGARVFTRSNGTWTQQGGKLLGTGAAANALQGYSVALSGDGNTALIGAYGDSGGIGAAFVFTRSGGVWTQSGGKITGALPLGPNVNLGQSIALSADGTVGLVGGHSEQAGNGAAWALMGAPASCTLDVDGNGSIDALTDGLLMLRAMFGLTGTAVTNGAVGGGAQRTTWAQLRPYLNGNCGAAFAP